MNHSKRGLNEPFYKWLDDVRRAIRKEKELQEKLQYYNVKLIGYKGVVYDRIGSSSTSPSEKDIVYWIEKINEVERKILSNKGNIIEYQRFINTLSINETVLISEVMRSVLSRTEMCLTINISVNTYNHIINGIIRKWGIKSGG